jgi:hypothetical protein
VLLPANFKLGRRSTLAEKKAYWDDFAEKVLRHFPLENTAAPAAAS